MQKRYACPCCGYLTRSEKSYGTFEICPICFWEDDDFQLDHPNFAGGANHLNLNISRENYKKFGVSDKRFLNKVRPPRTNEIPYIR